MKDNNYNNPNPKKMPRSLLYYYGIAILIILIFNLVIMPAFLSRQVRTTTYFDFINSIEAGEVQEVQFLDTEIRYTKIENGQLRIFKTGIVDNPELPQMLQEKGINYAVEIPEKPNLLLSALLSYGIPILIFFLIGRQINKNMASKMGAAGLNIHGQGGAKVYTPDKDKKTFEDVAGQEEAKESLMEIKDYLNNPKKYE